MRERGCQATESSTEEDWEQDELFSRIRKLTETMIAQGEASLKFEFKNLGRVISNYHSDDDDEEAIENEGDSGEEPKDKGMEGGVYFIQASEC